MLTLNTILSGASLCRDTRYLMFDSSYLMLHDVNSA
jgi:hypothetical protein